MRYPLPAFADLLVEHLQRAKLTPRDLSALTCWPLSYCQRLVYIAAHTAQPVGEPTLHVLADVLMLGPAQRDEMLAAAGYLPSDDGILALAYHIECSRQHVSA